MLLTGAGSVLSERESLDLQLFTAQKGAQAGKLSASGWPQRRQSLYLRTEHPTKVFVLLNPIQTSRRLVRRLKLESLPLAARLREEVTAVAGLR